jgi:hypothetical protein
MANYATNPLDFYTGTPLAGYDFGTQIPGGFETPEFGMDTLSSAAEGLAPSASPSPAKPGSTDSPFANAYIGGSLLLEGIGDMIRGIRGMEPAPQRGIATRMITDYLAQKRSDERLDKILSRIGGLDKDSSALASALLKPAALKTDNPLQGLG